MTNEDIAKENADIFNSLNRAEEDALDAHIFGMTIEEYREYKPHMMAGVLPLEWLKSKQVKKKFLTTSKIAV